MNASTIKTLAEYIAKLHQDNMSLEHPENYANDETDTNGVALDHAESVSPRVD